MSDEDAKRYIKYLLHRLRKKKTLIAEHEPAPHLRVLQETSGKEIYYHGFTLTGYEATVEASEVALFGNATLEAQKKLDEECILSVFERVYLVWGIEADIEARVSRL